MTDLSTLKDIEKMSLDMLKGSKAWGVLPTPVDKIVSYSDLTVNTKIDIAIVHEGYLARASVALQSALSKIRGLLDRKEKVVYVDMSQLPTRKNFVKLHEVGHNALPWQRETHELFADDDRSLSMDTKEQFEVEANVFASMTLFQHDRFITEARKLNLSMESVVHLSKAFGASIHATLRRYVENSPKRCALLVLEKLPDGQNGSLFGRRNYFTSEKFSHSFGPIEWPEFFGHQWEFIRMYLSNRKGIKSGSINLETSNGIEVFTYQFFNNHYNGFVFLYPVGEKQFSRTTIILR